MIVQHAFALGRPSPHGLGSGTKKAGTPHGGQLQSSNDAQTTRLYPTPRVLLEGL